MGRGSTAARREGDLMRRCYAGLDGPAFQAEAVRSIHALLPVDAVFFATADPATLLFTGAAAEDPLAAATAQFLDNEFGRHDVNKFQSLATGARHVATLDATTRGQRAASARYREIMSPLGLGDELRAALVTPAGCWGYLCLHRADSPHGFTPAEVRLIGRLTPHLGNGCRHSLTVPYRDPSGIAATTPGVVVLHPDLTVAAITGEAERWPTSPSPPSPARPNAGWPASPTIGPARGACPWPCTPSPPACRASTAEPPSRMAPRPCAYQHRRRLAARSRLPPA